MLVEPLRHTVSASGGSPGSILNSTSCCLAKAAIRLSRLPGEPRSSLSSSSKVMVA